MGADELLSTAEAGARLGVSRQRVLELIADGRLPARKVGRSYSGRPWSRTGRQGGRSVVGRQREASADEQRQRRHELLLYQDKLEGVLYGLDKFMPDWPAERRETLRGWLAEALARVRADLAEPAEPEGER